MLWLRQQTIWQEKNNNWSHFEPWLLLIDRRHLRVVDCCDFCSRPELSRTSGWSHRQGRNSYSQRSFDWIRSSMRRLIEAEDLAQGPIRCVLTSAITHLLLIYIHPSIFTNEYKSKMDHFLWWTFPVRLLLLNGTKLTLHQRLSQWIDSILLLLFWHKTKSKIKIPC